MNWSVSALLAAVLWVDGIRMVPAGSIVLRRVLTGPWRVAAVSETDGLHFVGWWPPFSLTLVLTDEPAREGSPYVQSDSASSRGYQSAPKIGAVDRLENNRPADKLWNAVTRAGTHGRSFADGQFVEQLSNIATHLRILRFLGSCLVLALVIVVPLAARDFGAFGLVAAITGVFALVVTCAGLTVAALRRLDADLRAAVKLCVPLLWPFSAPNSAERVLAHAFRDSSTIQAAACLLGPDEFARWIRPVAYDILGGVGNQPSAVVPFRASQLLSLAGSEVLRAVIAAQPDELLLGSAYCPRCGREYRPDARRCADCPTIALFHQSEMTTLLGHAAIAPVPP